MAAAVPGSLCDGDSQQTCSSERRAQCCSRPPAILHLPFNRNHKSCAAARRRAPNHKSTRRDGGCQQAPQPTAGKAAGGPALSPNGCQQVSGTFAHFRHHRSENTTTLRVRLSVTARTASELFLCSSSASSAVCPSEPGHREAMWRLQPPPVEAEAPWLSGRGMLKTRLETLRVAD